jgi:dTDP-4-amino-4,6-dideoxygalactose transaminase
MKKIQMVDLQGQYQDIKAEVAQRFETVLDQASFINGPEVQSFSTALEKYLDVAHVIPCANGTDALQIAMMGLDLQPGDEVITADFTFAATVEVIALLQLTPVLVDVLPDTFCIDPQAIERAITPKTKAIVPVHLFGQCADMEAILAIAQKHNLYVVEDNAQAIGATYTFSDGRKAKAGTMGHVGCTSFFPSKNLGCYGDGGALFCQDEALAHRLRGIVNHGMYLRYHHDVVGVNSRLDSLQAAVLNAKLPRLDSYNQKRRLAAQRYNSLLSGVPGVVLPKMISGCGPICAQCDCHVFHQYTLLVPADLRDGLVAHLQSLGIPSGVYYPIPLHRQKAYLSDRYNEADFEVTNRISDQVISLPMHTELDEEQQTYIAQSLAQFLCRDV